MMVGRAKPTVASVAPGLPKGILIEDGPLDHLGLSINK